MSPFFNISANKQESSLRSCLGESRESLGHTELLGVVLWIKRKGAQVWKRVQTINLHFVRGGNPTKQNRRDELTPAEHDFYFHLQRGESFPLGTFSMISIAWNAAQRSCLQRANTAEQNCDSLSCSSFRRA